MKPKTPEQFLEKQRRKGIAPEQQRARAQRQREQEQRRTARKALRRSERQNEALWERTVLQPALDAVDKALNEYDSATPLATRNAFKRELKAQTAYVVAGLQADEQAAKDNWSKEQVQRMRDLLCANLRFGRNMKRAFEQFDAHVAGQAFAKSNEALLHEMGAGEPIIVPEKP